MFRSASLFIGTSFTVPVFTIFATSNVDSIVSIPHKIYSMQRILIHIKSRSLCLMCPSAPRVCNEPGGQKPVLSLSLDRIKNAASQSSQTRMIWKWNIVSNVTPFRQFYFTSKLQGGYHKFCQRWWSKSTDSIKNCMCCRVDTTRCAIF